MHRHSLSNTVLLGLHTGRCLARCPNSARCTFLPISARPLSAMYSTATQAYEIKDGDRIDRVFADKKNVKGEYEYYEIDDPDMPSHIPRVTKGQNMDEDFEEYVPKGTKIDPLQYTMENREQLEEKGVSFEPKGAEHYKKYTHEQHANIMSQGFSIEMPKLPDVEPDKPFDQMSPDEFRAYASESFNHRLMNAQVKIPKPTIDEEGNLREAVFNASDAELGELYKKTLEEKQRIKEIAEEHGMKPYDSKEWESVVSLEKQLKQIVEDEEKPYERVKPKLASASTVIGTFAALFLFSFVLLGLTQPGVRALVIRPLIEKVSELTGVGNSQKQTKSA